MKVVTAKLTADLIRYKIQFQIAYNIHVDGEDLVNYIGAAITQDVYEVEVRGL